MADAKTLGFISVENWSYMVSQYPNKDLEIWHHVTPADGGYGSEVSLHIEHDYFKMHSVKELYRAIARQHFSPDPKLVKRRDELAHMRDFFKYHGYIES